MVKFMRLVNEENKSMDCLEVGSKAMGVLSEERLKVLRLLSEGPKYPAEIARQMGVEIQSIYYHIRLLEKSKLIRFLEYEERGGAAAKKYCLASNALSIIIKEDWKGFAGKSQKIPTLISPFIQNGFFNGKIIVGSPDPHGKYRARGSEFSMMELTMLLGQYCTFAPPLYLLDTIATEKDRTSNLILAGGPKVNTIVGEINKSLPIRFEKDSFTIYSTLSKKKYGENVGVVELINNPFSKNSKLLLIGGLNYAGTKSAVLSILTKMNELEKGNKYDSKIMAKVVQGYDEKGSGMIDTVEILE
jgi:DNA-binding transcriptional ArsR family regulator